ncbi:MAG: hypothetical protein ACLKAK_10095 [Alkaliphilus sp.]
MNKKKALFLATRQFLFLIYFALTTGIYFIALKQGNYGITLKLFRGGDDGFFYWEQAVNVATGQDAILSSIYQLIIGYIFKLVGYESVFLIRVFNQIGFLLLVWLALYLIKMFSEFKLIGIELKATYNSKIMMLLLFLCYLTLQMNVNLSIYRDVWIYSSYLLSVILAIRVGFYKKNRLMYALILVPVLGILAGLREYALISFVITSILYFIYKKILRTKNKVLFFIVCTVLFGIYYTLFKDFAAPIVNLSLRDALSYREFAVNRVGIRSQMQISLNQTSFIVFIINYIHSYVGNLLGPLPWHITNWSTAIA